MKNISVLLLIITIAFLSCDSQKIPKSLPVEKVYILEFAYSDSSYNRDNLCKTYLPGGMELIGFAELGNNFDLRVTKQLSQYNNEYSEVRYTLPDSLRTNISKIIRENQQDTTYTNENAYSKSPESYYMIIIQRKFYSSTKIFLTPNSFPDDLKYLYEHIYKNSILKMKRNNYGGFIEKVENETRKIMLDRGIIELPPPPPILRETIKYTPPVIIEDDSEIIEVD